MPDWAKKRIKNLVYVACIGEEVFKAENIFNFCQSVIVSIEPLWAEKVICLTERKDDVLKIRFTLPDSENVRQQSMKNLGGEPNDNTQ